MDILCIMFLAVVVFGAHLMNLGIGKNCSIYFDTHRQSQTRAGCPKKDKFSYRTKLQVYPLNSYHGPCSMFSPSPALAVAATPWWCQSNVAMHKMHAAACEACAVVTGFLEILFYCINFFLFAALTGISLVYTIQLACEMSIYGVKRCFDVDAYMNCVQRIMGLIKVEPEAGYNIPTQPHEPWPSAGQICFKNVSLTYKNGAKKALKEMNILIHPREKIGIVGRNGTGKSSFIYAMFRMPEIKGQIFIDDIDVKAMNLQRMRRGISVITKDPVIFCGNVRSNIDPFSNYTDRQIWEVLEKTHIRAWVEALPKQLYQDMAECCATLGASEKQLFSFARALLCNTKILVMDEATAGVDYKTDRLIQEMIRSKFKNSTIITIPYRLSTIIDYDRVMVLDNGHITEFDKPEKLLKKSDGLFAHLYSSQCAI